MYGQIIHRRTLPDAALVEGFRGIWSSTLADTMGRHGVMNGELRPIFHDISFVGVALTVLNYPNDNITTHRALRMLSPGDVLVIDEGPGSTTGAFGHNMSLEARKNGAVALVTNGHIRDVRLLRNEGFPVFCRGVCPRSAQKHTPGSVNVPVAVGGLVVNPGDIVVGDDDGIAVIPLADAQQILERAQARMAMEHQQARDIRNGEKPLEIVHGRNWLETALEGKVREIE
ncbi:MAG: 4-carboxy-4-hydroxy-2-oxoadipate aldolase/oxaloacetate decarboxylase [Pseudomonadota bacterium]|nr:4-carboxy-4-hydroxy-2-oxoadipate aldolase/oxaloacetate decarboxylase [Pseudomonadota bacterium]